MTTQKYKNLFLPDCKKCRFLLVGFYCTWKEACIRTREKQVQEWKFDVSHAFKCNLKELTTKSALSAWGQRSLACACPVAGYIDHVIHWRVQFSFVLGSVSHFLTLPSPPGFVGFSPMMFVSVTGACCFPFVWGLMAGLRCCASHGGIISV